MFAYSRQPVGRHPVRERLLDWLIARAMAPISIDGADITGVTIDGATVQEVTVDGDVVYSEQPSDGVGRWNFEDDSDTSTAVDTWGNNDATLKNGPTYKSASQVDDKSLDFDGSDDYAEVAASALASDSEHTITLWINRDGYDNSDQKYARYVANGDTGVYYHFENSHYRAVVGGTDSASSVSASTDTWTHLAVKLESGTGYLYIDGTQEASASTSGSDGGANWIFGDGGQISSNHWYNGQLDDVRFYDAAISDSRIQDIANGNA